MSNNTIDIVLQVLGSSATRAALKGASDDIKKVGDVSDKAASSAAKVGKDTSGLSNLDSEAKKATDSLGAVESQTDKLNNTFEKARNWGAGIALAGGAGLMLSNSLIQVAEEGAKADQKLTAMAAKRGEGGRIEELATWASDLSMQAALVDDDPIKEAAAGLYGFGVNADQIKGIMPGLIGQSRLYNQSLDQTAMAFGKAFASGNAGALKRVGLTITDADVQYVKDANSETERSARLYEVVKRSMDKFALSMTEGMSASEIATNRAANSMDTSMTKIGNGSKDAQASITGMATSIIAWGATSDRVAYNSGWILTVASNAMAAGGSLVAFGGQLGQAYIGLIALRNARAANALAATAEADAQTLSAAATTATGTAAAVAAPSTAALALAEDSAAVAAGTDALAQDAVALSTTAAGAAASGAAVQVGLLAAVQGTAMTSLGAASVGLIALVTGVGIAVGTVVAGMIYKLGQMLGLIDKNRSMMKELGRGWDVATGNTQGAEAAIGRDMYDKQMTDMKAKAADMRSSGKSEKEIDDFTRETSLKIETSYAEQFKKHGDTEDYVKHSEAAGALRKQDEASAGLVMPVVPATAIAPGSTMATGVAATAAAPSTTTPEAVQTQIDAVSAQMANTKDPKAKKQLGLQKAALQRAKQAAAKADRDAKKKATQGSKASSAEVAAQAQGELDDLKDDLDEQKDIAKDALDKQTDAIKKQIKMHLVGKDAGQVQIDALKEKHEHLMEAEAQESEAKQKRIEAQMIMSEAAATAASQDADTAAATMRIAQAKSSRAMRAADRAMARMEREQTKSDEVNVSGGTAGLFAKFAKRTGSFVSRGGGMFDPNAGRGQVYTAVPTVKQSPTGDMVIQFAPIKMPQGGADAALAGF